MEEMRRFWMCWVVVGAVACARAEPRPPAMANALAERAAPAELAKAREHGRAGALVKEADARLKVDLEGALEKYGQALELEPTNVGILWKLSLAYEKKEDWAAVASTLTRAARLAPGVAATFHRLGNALVRSAEESEANVYEAARAPLLQCLKLAPQLADCAYLLGEVEEWADHPQAAAERYTEAAQHDATRPHYYRALAALYRVFRRTDDAERVLNEGMKRVERGERNRASLARMSVSLAQLSAGRHDIQASQAWLEQAEALFDESSPEVAFEIGAIYAATPDYGAGVSNRERARPILEQFVKRTCRGALAASFKEQCELSQLMLQLLGATSAPRSAAKAPPLAVRETPKPGLPTPQLEMRPLRSGEAYTVWGASYALRSRQHRREVTDKPIAITGYVVRTNFADAPRCAVHRSGLADPEDCRADIPAFWLGEEPAAAEADSIKVMGFASNYAQLYEAIRQADSQHPDAPYADSYWGQTVPNPLPAAGAKLTVQGNYGLTFAKASSGAESDPVMGLLDFAEREVLEPAPELATLPGVKRRKR